MNAEKDQKLKIIMSVLISFMYKKDHDPDNHDDVITHLDLEYEVKWALGSMTMNKAGGGDGIPSKGISNPKR